MDFKLVRLLEQVSEGNAKSGDIARFLARFSWQLLESPNWEDVAVTSELEYAVAELQAGMESEESLLAFAQEALDLWRRPRGIVPLNKTWNLGTVAKTGKVYVKLLPAFT